jgi:2-polyprenyl-6-methoxyphenol hydroxylase-like FAD-dependent oxidoreductase
LRRNNPGDQPYGGKDQPAQPQVLIVGAGPVGLTLAVELARYDVPLRIIDKAANRTDKSKALVLWSRTLELLARSGDAAPFIDAGFKAEAVNIIAGDNIIGRVAMGSIDTPFPFGLMLPQSETERLLEERLNSFGVTVERRVELVQFTPSDDEVEATLDGPGGEQVSSFAWLIGCDGAHSAVRHGLALPFTGETLDSDWMLADIHMTGYPCPDTEASVYWHRDGVFVIFPIAPGRYRVLADLPSSGATQPPTPTLEQVQTVIDRRGPSGLVAFDPIWLAGFRINGRKVADYRQGRVFLAGDAAHVHSPAGGQGMNTGMQDSFNLAWKLAMVVSGQAGASLLDSYSPERGGVGDEVLKSAGRLTAVGTLRNPLAQELRNLVAHIAFGFAPVRQAFATAMTEVAIGYPDSPLNGAALRDRPKPGERVAPLAGEVPVGSGNIPRFALAAAVGAATADLIARFGGVVDPELWPAVQTGVYWLVRPDGYVACASQDPAVIASYLEALTVSS